MPCQYKLKGTLKFRDNPTTGEAARRIMGRIGLGVTDDRFHGPGIRRLVIDHDDTVTIHTPAAVEEWLKKLEPHLVEPACLEVSSSGEAGEWWLGEPAAVEAARSARLADEARDAIRRLTPAARAKLLEELNRMNFEDDGAEEHEHKWGPLERSQLAGTVHRRCQVPGCKEINALDDDALEFTNFKK